MNKPLLRIFLLFLFAACKLQAQQLPIFNQYRLNEFLVNPSVAGYDGFTSINITGREQWIGISDPPRTGTFSFQTRILKSNLDIKSSSGSTGRSVSSRTGRVGMGGFFYSDNNGAISQTGASLAYAYHIYLNNKQLSLGLAANLFQFSVAVDQLTFSSDDRPDSDPDAAIANVQKPFFIPDFSMGINISSYSYMFGFSISQMMASELGSAFYDLDEPVYRRHYYFIGKYRNRINSNWEYEPFAILKIPEGLKMQLDISSIFIYEKDYWLGAGLRRDYKFTDLNNSVNTIIFLLGLRYDRVYFGYSLDYPLIKLVSNSLGSHEFILAIKLGSGERRFRWLERY